MKKIVVLLALVLTLGACSWNAPPEPAPTETVTVTEGARELEPRREVEPERGHDWPSVDAYRADMADSTDKISNNLMIWHYATADWIEGFYTDQEFLDLNFVFYEALLTHIDHFEGTTPPAEYASAHDKILRSWDLLAKAAEYVEQGIINYDLDYIERATETLEEANRLAEQAGNEMPGVGSYV